MDKDTHTQQNVEVEEIQKEAISYDTVVANSGFRFRWMQHALLWVLVSLCLFLGSVGAFFYKGMNWGIDFTGGHLLEAQFSDEQSDEQRVISLRQDLMPEFSGLYVQSFGEKTVLFRLSVRSIGEKGDNTDFEALRNRLQEQYAEKIDFVREEFIGPTVGVYLIKAGILAISLALLGIVIYIWVRFDWPFALGAMVALLHDVVIVCGIFSVFSITFDISIVAALLMILGYSINDTVVIYDRVRSNLCMYRQVPLRRLLELSLNQTLSRTLITSGTSVLALLALLVFAGKIIQPFVIAMTCGVIIGTYSTIFVAAPFLMTVGVRKIFKGQAQKKPFFDRSNFSNLLMD